MKNVIIQESVRSKVTSKEAIKLANKAKKLTGTVGTEGTLKRNILFRILKNSIIIF
jgi:hypothetical protein